MNAQDFINQGRQGYLAPGKTAQPASVVEHFILGLEPVEVAGITVSEDEELLELCLGTFNSLPASLQYLANGRRNTVDPQKVPLVRGPVNIPPQQELPKVGGVNAPVQMGVKVGQCAAQRVHAASLSSPAAPAPVHIGYRH